MSDQPIIIGFGPAGMFAALELVDAGIKPRIFERGKKIEARSIDVQRFIKERELDPQSNIQFGEGGAGSYSDGKLFSRKENSEYVKKVLQDNKNVRWTCVFMHEPLFMKAYDGKNQNWLKIEKLLDNRKYNLFAGHYHGYQKFIRNGHKYIRLATTGGASNLSGIKNGAFDQIMWVTMTDNGPVIANIALNGLLDEDLK